MEEVANDEQADARASRGVTWADVASGECAAANGVKAVHGKTGPVNVSSRTVVTRALVKRPRGSVKEATNGKAAGGKDAG